MKTDFIQIASYASKAPSGHNTQPWKFHITDSTITVLPNLDVALPVVDRNNRELFISLGCAVENLCIAASYFGYTTHIIECSIEAIILELTKNALTIEDSLFHQIEKRQTNRKIYNGNKISDGILQQLQSIPKENGIQFYFTEINTPFANTITQYIMKGNEIQMADIAFKNELLSWMRFNKKQVEATHNGLSYLVFGNPPLPRILARPIVSLFLKPNAQNKSDRKKIDSSSHFVVCATQRDTIEEWINLGRTLQRFLLKVTEIGISYAFLNQPCEVAALAFDLREKLPVNKEHPTLIMRIGYAKQIPYSPRKKIETLLV
ncbi:nitroreductase [Bacteroides fragilis]|uniref:Acg family FMN-binding oxidoreductase n=1 Tax=Bacteroides fragilis TaxID=817 RepID=UPI0005F8E8A5|nr:nitroreductase [Bacteroides fragilis]AKA52974.1 nitroreductase [Bacteroides fragilis]